MARRQTFNCEAETVVPTAGTPVPLASSPTFATCFYIEAKITNTDFIKVGNATRQLHNLAPGEFIQFEMDKLDHGTQAVMDAREIYIDALVSGEGVVWSYLGGS